MNNVTISACIPTYNRANYLRCTITSLINQTEAIDEIVVIDDGSTDDTESVVKSFESQNRIKYYKIEKERNKDRYLTLAETFNYCIDKATFDFVSIIGDDDSVSNKWCEIIKNTIHGRQDDVGIFFFSTAVISERNQLKMIWRHVKKDLIASGNDVFVKTISTFGMSGNFVFKKQLMIDIGKFGTGFGTYFDKEFYCRLVSLKIPIFFSNQVLFFSRSHSGQAARSVLHDHVNIEDKINSFLQNSEFICKILSIYKNFFLKEDFLFRNLINHKFLSLFKNFFINSFCLRELSFLYVQGFYKEIQYKRTKINSQNYRIITKYFGQINSKLIKLFFIYYYFRYWIWMINIKSMILAYTNRIKDSNLKIFIN